jgi:predicted nucleic acid-binding protein
VSDIVVDASLALQWLLEDESDREYSIAILASLTNKRALVPALWFYEVGNGLLMAYRRKRIALDQIDGFLARLQALPIEVVQQSTKEILALVTLANRYGLTSYDAAYLATAIASGSPLATTDRDLRKAATDAHVTIVTV